jgi:hypothetical protein
MIHAQNWLDILSERSEEQAKAIRDAALNEALTKPKSSPQMAESSKQAIRLACPLR